MPSILLLLILLSPGKLAARPDSTPAVPSPDYLLPDLAPKWMTHDGRLFTNKIGFAVFYDYTSIDQDAANVEQVGVQESSYDLRAGRLMLNRDDQARPAVVLQARGRLQRGALRGRSDLRRPRCECHDPVVGRRHRLDRQAERTVHLRNGG